MSLILVHTKVETPIGEMDLLATDRGICLLEFDVRTDLDEEIESIRKDFDAVLQIGENRHTLELKKQLKEYFELKRKVFSVPTVLLGTYFQKKVWTELKKIPFGNTVTYKEQSEKLGDVKAIRAVAKTLAEFEAKQKARQAAAIAQLAAEKAALEAERLRKAQA